MEFFDQLTSFQLYAPILLFLFGTLNWMYLFLIDNDNPSPLLLHLTFFANIGIPLQIINDFSLNKTPRGLLIILLMLTIILAIAQILVYQKQYKLTVDNLSFVLREKLFHKKKVNEEQLQRWKRIGEEYIAVDFFPEFYKSIYMKLHNQPGPRAKKSEEFLELLTAEIPHHGIVQENFEVPQETRKIWWRLYVGIFITSWFFYILATLIPQGK